MFYISKVGLVVCKIVCCVCESWIISCAETELCACTLFNQATKTKKSKLKKYPSRPYPCWKIAFPLSSLGFFLSQQLTVMDTIDTHYYQQITVDFSFFFICASVFKAWSSLLLLSIYNNEYNKKNYLSSTTFWSLNLYT